jgi:hypothetical protein
VGVGWLHGAQECAQLFVGCKSIPQREQKIVCGRQIFLICGQLSDRGGAVLFDGVSARDWLLTLNERDGDFATVIEHVAATHGVGRQLLGYSPFNRNFCLVSSHYFGAPAKN